MFQALNYDFQIMCTALFIFDNFVLSSFNSIALFLILIA